MQVVESTYTQVLSISGFGMISGSFHVFINSAQLLGYYAEQASPIPSQPQELSQTY